MCWHMSVDGLDIAVCVNACLCLIHAHIYVLYVYNPHIYPFLTESFILSVHVSTRIMHMRCGVLCVCVRGMCVNM